MFTFSMVFAKKNKSIVFLFGLFFVLLFFAPFSFGEHGSFVAYAQNATSSDAWLNQINPFSWVLIGTQKAVAWFTTGAIALLTKFIDAKLTTDLLTSTATREVWAAVRDVCNLAFILTLLFSAFATIFHIEKYHIKSIIVKLVLMAILVNFSLPITRFVIDLGNVPMYYLAQQIFGSSGTANIGGQIADESNLICVLVPHYGSCKSSSGTETTSAQYAENDFSLIIASTILLFLFCITIFSLALLFLIRTIGLVLLIMFSPIGFVGIAVPALNKYANEFWETLIKYVIFGPMMLFILAVSLKMMAAVRGSTGNAGSLPLFSGLDSMVKTIVTLAPPIVVLWMGMAVAQKSSVAGASMVMGAAQKFATGAGKKFSGYNFATRHLSRWTSQRKAQREDRARQRMDWFMEKYDTTTGKALEQVGKLGLVLPGLSQLASSSARDRIQRAESTYDARVNDHMGKIKNADNGMELVQKLKQVRNKAEYEAVLRQAAKTDNLDDVVTSTGNEATAEGLLNAIHLKFGDNDKSNRLVRSLGMAEAAHNHAHWLGVSSYDKNAGGFVSTHSSKYTGGKSAGQKYRAKKQFDAVFGQHPQQAWRKITKDHVVVKGARGRHAVTDPITGESLRFSDDFEAMLNEMTQGDFDNALDYVHNNDGAVKQMPNVVVEDIQHAIDAGAVPTGRTKELIDILQTAGRLHP